MIETTWPPNILRVKQGCQGFFRGRGGDELPSHRRHTFFYQLQESLRLQEKQLYVILSCIPSKREAPCLGLAVSRSRSLLCENEMCREVVARGGNDDTLEVSAVIVLR